jgi:hypothetical protein
MTALPGLAPPYSLRLSRPAWGVDPSTKRMAFGGLVPTILKATSVGLSTQHPLAAEPVLRWATVSLPEHASLSVRLAAWAGRIGQHVETLRDDWGYPALVGIEQPFSSEHQTEPTSYYALAALLVALGLRVPEAEIVLMPPQTWKLQATGSGYAPGIPAAPRGSSKAEKRAVSAIRRRAEKDRLLRWAIEAGYTGSIQDEADACGVATAAGVLLEGR